MFVFNKVIVKKLNLAGLHCNGCAKRVEKAFLEMKQVKSCVVSYENMNAELKLKKDLTDEQIKEVVSNLGFEVISIE